MKLNAPRQICVGDGYEIRTEQLTGIIKVISLDNVQKIAHVYKVPTKRRDDEDSISSSHTGTAVAERLVVGAARPIAISMSELLSLDETELKQLKFERSFHTKMSPSQLNVKKQLPRFLKIKGRIEDTWSAVKDYLSLELGTYSQVIQLKANKHGVHRTTLARDMSRFYECGLDADAAAMMTMFSRAVRQSGATKKRVITKKLGRPNKRVKSGHDLTDLGNNVSDRAQEMIRRFLKTVKNRESHNYKTMYDDFIDKFALRPNGNIANGLVLMERDPEMQMKPWQFRYHAQKCESPLSRQIKKVGQKKFNLNHRVLTGYAKQGIGFPGHTYLIDSTIIDVYCVSAIDRRLLIGRPVVYVVIDAFSQMIMSVHVSLEGPDMDEAKIALYRAITSKDEFFESLGASGCKDAFVQGVKPLSIFADRGELLSKDGRHLAEVVQCMLSIAAPYRADWKSLVERYFGIQNTGIVHRAPGAVVRHQQERGDRDYRHDAVLTINELTRLLLNLAATWNMTHDLSSHVSCKMLKDEVEATPRAFWDYGIKHLHGSPTYIEKTTAVKNFLPTIQAKVDKAGVHALNNMRFTANWMRDKESFFEITQQTERAKVFLNPDKPMGAYLLDPTDNDLMECELVDTRGYSSMDISVEDIQGFEEYQPLKAGDNAKSKEMISDSFAHESKQIIESAMKATAIQKKTDGRSKSKQVADIKANRKKEVLSLFQKGVVLPDPRMATAEKSSSDDFYAKFIARQFKEQQ